MRINEATHSHMEIWIFHATAEDLPVENTSRNIGNELHCTTNMVNFTNMIQWGDSGAGDGDVHFEQTKHVFPCGLCWDSSS